MKKLMFAAVAMAAGVALADLTSANIVGYTSKAVDTGFVLVAPCFTAVGGGEYNLADFKLAGDNVVGDGSIQIQVLTTAGANEETYVWLNEDVGQTPGWYDFDSWEPITATIKAGQGFLINIPETCAGTAIKTAGEVSQAAKQVALPTGFIVLGNSTPVAKNISEFTLGADAVDDGAIQIQVLTTAGVNEETYVWLGENVGMTPGWYDFDSWEPITVDIKAGEALLFNNPNAETTLTIPSAL